LKAVVDRCAGSCHKPRVDDKGRRAGKEVILPDIWGNGHNAAAGTDEQLGRGLPGELNARLPRVPVGGITRLWVNNELLDAVDGAKRGGAASALGDGGVKVPADAVVESQAGVDLPCVLEEEAQVLAVDGSGADVRAVGEWRSGDGDDIGKRTSGEKTGEGIGQWIAGFEVVLSCLRRDRGCGVGGAAAEVVFAVGLMPK